MGMSVGAAGKKRSRRKRGVPRYGAMAEINMTPFIDVVLVLLIIFMVAAPLLASGVPIDLPKTTARRAQGRLEAAERRHRRQGGCLRGRPTRSMDGVLAKLQEWPRTATTSASTCAAPRT